MTREFRIAAAGPCWETLDVQFNRVILRSPTKRDLVHRTMEIAQKVGQSKVIIFNADGYKEEERHVDHCQQTKLSNFLNYYNTHNDSVFAVK